MRKPFSYLSIIFIANFFWVCAAANAGMLERDDKEAFIIADNLINESLNYVKLKDFKKAGKSLDAAFKIAQEIKEPYSREILLNEVVNKYIFINDNENALKVALSIKFSDVRDELLGEIANKYVENSKLDLGIKTAKQIRDPFSKAKALYKIVNLLVTQEQYADAIKFAEKVEDSEVIEEVGNVQFLTKKILKEDYVFVTEQGFSGITDSNVLYRKSKELTELANRFFCLYLIEVSKKILIRSAKAAEKIDSPALKKDAQQRIEVVRSKITGFIRSLDF